MADIKKIAEELVNLTVKEVNELAQVLKDEYGIEPAAAAVAVAGPAAGGAAAPPNIVGDGEAKKKHHHNRHAKEDQHRTLVAQDVLGFLDDE